MTESKVLCVFVSLAVVGVAAGCGGPLEPRGYDDSAGAAGSDAGAAGLVPSSVSLSLPDGYGGRADTWGSGLVTGIGGGSSSLGGTGGKVTSSGTGSAQWIPSGTTGSNGAADAAGGYASEAQTGAADPAGCIGQYEPGCTQSSDCCGGLGCLFQVGATTGVCFPFCDRSEDCPNPPGGCSVLGSPGVGYCMPNCDPRFAQNRAAPFYPCGAGAGCAVDGENAATYCTAESSQGREQGVFCRDSGECAPGHTCQDWTCSRYCLLGQGDCDGFARTSCTELAELSTGEVFGYCAGGSYAAADLPMSIPELSTIGSTITVPDDFVVSRVMVKVGISHPFCGDLTFSLVGPEAIAVLLSDANGASGADCYFETYFDDEAPLAITAGTPPFSNAYRPEQPLASMVGQSSQGDWTLVVSDTVSGDEGELTSFQLTLW